jgi:hypothetical protein
MGVGLEFSINRLPDDTIHVSGFRGEDAGVVNLNVMS